MNIFHELFKMGEGDRAKTTLGESFDFTVKYGCGGSIMTGGVNICLFYVSFFL